MGDSIERRLSPETASAEEFSSTETATVTQQSFNEGLDQVKLAYNSLSLTPSMIGDAMPSYAQPTSGSWPMWACRLAWSC